MTTKDPMRFECKFCGREGVYEAEVDIHRDGGFACNDVAACDKRCIEQDDALESGDE